MGSSFSQSNNDPLTIPAPTPPSSNSSKRGWLRRPRSQTKEKYPNSKNIGSDTFHTFDSDRSPNAKFRSGDGIPPPPNGIMAYTREGETDRQLLQHDILKYCFGGLYHAPIKDMLNVEGARVLDMGCGSGRWVTDMASEFPNAKFTGIDVLPVAVDESTPPNCEFIINNIIDDFLPNDDNTFDFVVIRNMVLTLKVDDWQMFLNEAFRVTKRGGYVEIVETDIRAKRAGSLASKWTEKVAIALTARDCDPLIYKKLDGLMTSHGFDVISHDYRSVPIGKWGNDIGKMVMNDWVGVCKTLKAWALVALGLTSEKFDELVNAIDEEMDTHEGYFNWYWGVGRKPPVDHDLY